MTPQTRFCSLTRKEVLDALRVNDAANEVFREVERLVQAYREYFAEKARQTGPIPPSVVVKVPDTPIGVVALEAANERLCMELGR